MAAWVTVATAALALAGAAGAQDFDAVRIETTDLGSGLYMLTGAGGNIGVSVGEDGTFLVDDEYAPLTEKILAAVRALSAEPVRFVVNTHWHGDHTGGNENLGGEGALLVAHRNVRKRMSVEQFIEAFGRRVPASPKLALPIVTFEEGLSFHLNGWDIDVFHVAPAHTDGDSVVHFREPGVFHMGDTFFSGSYPFIDVSSGGALDGMIGAANRVLELAGPNAKIIPGHGKLSDRAGLESYRDMLVVVRDRIAKEIAAGKDVDAVVAAKPTADLDARWGGGFMKPDAFVRIAYQTLAK